MTVMSKHGTIRLILYETDELIETMYPLTLTRPVCHLLFGSTTIGARIAAATDSTAGLVLTHPALESPGICPTDEDGAAVGRTMTGTRPSRKTPGNEAIHNGSLPFDTLFVSSGFIPEKAPLAADLPRDRALLFRDRKGELVAFYLPAHEGRLGTEDVRNPTGEVLVSKTALEPMDVRMEGLRISYPWELMRDNPQQLRDDLNRGGFQERETEQGSVHPSAVVRGDGDVVVSAGARVDPFVLLDSSSGPIYLAPGVQVKSHSTVEGPAFIGENSLILGALIRGGCTIGRECRIGGEVEQSILHGCVNKYHYGFLGHSYVGSWVNFGAGSTNSDLKNNYRNVRVRLQDREVDTMQTKIGAFVGDHVKTGIGTLMNTGFVCGVGANLFGGRGTFSGSIPSFAWGDGGKMQEYRLEEFEKTAELVMRRRGVEMSDRYRRLLRSVFKRTRSGRQEYLGRVQGT